MMGAAPVIVVLLLAALLDFQRVRQKSWKDPEWKKPARLYSLPVILGTIGLVATLIMAGPTTPEPALAVWVAAGLVLLLLGVVALLPVIYFYFFPAPKDATEPGAYGGRE